MSDLEGTENFEGKKHDMPMPGWWRERSLAEKILMGIGFGILGIGFLALCGWVLMLLWNWLMPDIFGLKLITYWQAWGLLLLSSILFKRMGPGGPRPSSEYRRKKKLKTYIHEEHFNKPDSAE